MRSQLSTHEKGTESIPIEKHCTACKTYNIIIKEKIGRKSKEKSKRKKKEKRKNEKKYVLLEKELWREEEEICRPILIDE